MYGEISDGSLTSGLETDEQFIAAVRRLEEAKVPPFGRPGGFFGMAGSLLEDSFGSGVTVKQHHSFRFFCEFWLGDWIHQVYIIFIVSSYVNTTSYQNIIYSWRFEHSNVGQGSM